MIQFKSLNGLSTLVLASGLIASNFMSLNMLAKKDGGIPDIAKLSSTPYSSLQIRSEKGADGAEEWTLNSRQHDPKTMLTYTDETSPTFSGKTKTKYTHKESVAQFAILPRGENGKLTAKQIECIEQASMAKGNAQMISDTGNTMYVTPALASLPVVGPVISGLWFGQSRKAAANLGKDISDQWNDC
tara:strand:- start:984 stop:1544 length:561 start_codon:yes stop_codon:yes gene_type:complete